MRANHSGENLHSRVSIYMCKGHLNILRHPRNSGTEKDKFCPFLINTAPDELQIIKRCLHAFKPQVKLFASSRTQTTRSMMLLIRLKQENDGYLASRHCQQLYVVGGCTGQSRMCTLPLLNLLSKCGRSLHHRPILRHRRKIAPLAAIVLMSLFLHNTNTSVCIQNMKVKLIDIKNKCYNLKFATKMTKCSLQVV